MQNRSNSVVRPRRPLLRLWYLIGGLSLMASGCGTLYELEIVARNEEGTTPQGTYVLLPGDSTVPVDSEEFQKYAAFVERGLVDKHLTRLPVSRIGSADMAIVVRYGTGDPEEVAYTNTVPMFQSISKPGPEPGPSGSGSGQTPQNTSESTGTVDPPPDNELLGTSTYTFVRTVFWRDLSLRAIAFDWVPNESPSVRKTADLWYVAVATQGSSTDLDEVMPAMVAAAAPYVGANLDQPVTEKLNGVSPRIKRIRGGSP